MAHLSARIVERRVTDPPARIVGLVGEHDLAVAGDVGHALAEAVGSGDPVIVDLRRTTFADSSILSALIVAHKQARERGFAVALPPDGEVTRLFDLTDARSILPTFATVRLAIDWCSAAAKRPQRLHAVHHHGA